MDLTVFRAEPDDAGALHELAAATFALACPPSTPQQAIDEFIAANFSEQHFASYLADPQRDVLLAVVDGEPAGYTMLVAGEPTDADVLAAISSRPTIELSKFYVLAGHHGGGVAAELMAATIESARDRGAASVWLGVNDENQRANRFYEKHGFVAVGSKHFRLGERLESDHVRELSL